MSNYEYIKRRLANAYQKRLERPLRVQFDHDRQALTELQKTLLESAEAVAQTIEKLDEDPNFGVFRENQSSNRWTNPVAEAVAGDVYGSFQAILNKYGITKESVRAGGLDYHYLIQELSRAKTFIIWNEAIELAAQIAGGSKGTLIRDLKEELIWGEEPE